MATVVGRRDGANPWVLSPFSPLLNELDPTLSPVPVCMWLLSNRSAPPPPTRRPPASYGEANYVEFSYPGIVAWEVQRDGDEEGFTLIYTWHRTRMAVLSLSLSQLQSLCETHPAGPVTS